MFGDNERIDLFSDTKLGSERFVEKFLAIHDSGEVAPEQVRNQFTFGESLEAVLRCGREQSRPWNWKEYKLGEGLRGNQMLKMLS